MIGFWIGGIVVAFIIWMLVAGFTLGLFLLGLAIEGTDDPFVRACARVMVVSTVALLASPLWPLLAPLLAYGGVRTIYRTADIHGLPWRD